MAYDPGRRFAGPPALTSDVGRALSRPTKSRPFWPPRSPRWILRCFAACNAEVPVEGGVYQVNRVPDGDWGTPGNSLAPEPVLDLPSYALRAAAAPAELTPVPTSVALFDTEPQEIALEPIQAIVRTQTRVADLFSDTHDQLQWQLNTSAEFMYETKENLVFNHPSHGLLHNVDPSMEFAVDGPPGPDVLDDLLARAWKRPDCFMMHPDALAEFHKQANARALMLEPVEIFGSLFTTWRGLPICATNKLQVTAADGIGGSSPSGREDTKESEWLPAADDADNRGEAGPADRPRARGKGRTDVLLLRLGLENQGVVSLHAAGTKSHPDLPAIAVEFMGLGDEAVSSYLLTTYTAVAVLSSGALGRAKVRI